MSYAIKINGRLVRDDRGCVYKYSNNRGGWLVL